MTTYEDHYEDQLVVALQAARKELRFWVELNSSQEMKESHWVEYQKTALMQLIDRALK